MPYTRPQLFELSKKVGRSWRTLQYWAAQGCDLNDPQSLERFLAEKNRKRTNVQKFRERRGIAQGASAGAQSRDSGAFEPQGNGDSAVAGRRGAQHALARLEQQEEESFRRLQTALQGGDRFEIDACQTYWLKVAETLRRLDVSIDLARRQAETQISLRQAEDVVTYVAEWLRIAVTQFLSSETVPLMGIKTSGDFRAYFLERFAGVMHLTIRNADKTRSAIPSWAKARIETAWNIQLPPEAVAASGTPGP
jgi:hypothetical protein